MKASEAIATVFGIGRAPVAPGTVMSIVAVLLAWPIAVFEGRFALLFAGIAVAAIGTWACEHYALDLRQSDPSEAVVDELAGQWLVCAFAPVSILAFALAFVLFRIFDILKPWPISRLEKIPGGLGIMADDLGAAAAAAAIIAICAHAGIV